MGRRYINPKTILVNRLFKICSFNEEKNNSSYQCRVHRSIHDKYITYLNLNDDNLPRFFNPESIKEMFYLVKHLSEIE